MHAWRAVMSGWQIARCPPSQSAPVRRVYPHTVTSEAYALSAVLAFRDLLAFIFTFHYSWFSSLHSHVVTYARPPLPLLRLSSTYAVFWSTME